MTIVVGVGINIGFTRPIVGSICHKIKNTITAIYL
jgi:hypothetical protein